MDKITINGVEFTEKEIEAIEKEYHDLIPEVIKICREKECFDNKGVINIFNLKSYDTFDVSKFDIEEKKKLNKFDNLSTLIFKIRKELTDREDIFKEQLEMKISEALKEEK